MAIAVVGTPDSTVNDADTYTAESGSNRLVVWAGSSGNSSHTVTSLTLGGETMTKLVSSASANAIQSSVGYLLEAVVATLSGAEATDITFNTAPGDFRGGALTLSGVHQTSTVTDSQAGLAADSTSMSIAAVNVVAGGIVLAIAGCGQDITALPSGYTSVFNRTGANPRCAFVYKLISADGTEDPVFTVGVSAIGRIVVLSLAPAAAAGVSITPNVGAVAVTGYAPTMDKGVGPGVGAITIAGYAPTLNISIIPSLAGNIAVGGTVSTLSIGNTIAIPVATLTAQGLAPTLDKAIIPPVGTLSASGLAATLGIGIPIPLLQLAISGNDAQISSGSPSFAPAPAQLLIGGGAEILADGTVVTADSTYWTGDGSNSGSRPPTLGFGFTFGVGSVTLLGYAPSFIATTNTFANIPLRSLTINGNDAQVVLGTYGGGGPGLLLALNLNLQVPNISFSPFGQLQFTGWSPEWGAGYSYGPAQASVSVSGYAPVVTTAEGGQAPVMDPPVALAITGYAPVSIAGLVVRFPFATTAEGFVATPGAGTAMIWGAGEGNPAGSLRSTTTGFSRNDDNTWTLATDWASLGIPANSIVTGISYASAESYVFLATLGGGTVKAVTLTPTGYPSIQISAARPFSVADSGWIQTAGFGTGASFFAQADSTAITSDSTTWSADAESFSGGSPLAIPSNGSLTITLGTSIQTGASGTPNVRVYQDNVTFAVSYYAAASASPSVGTVTATGYAPTVIALAAQFGTPPAGSLAIQGSGPTVQVVAPITGGGGGPGLLLALALNLEPVPLGNAQLVITGLAPSIFRPIVLAGSDDLFSGSASAVGTGNIVIVGGSTIESPANAALVIAGQAPTLVETGSRNFAMPVTALTITHFVPTPGVDFVREMAAGALVFEGQVLSIVPDSALTPQVALLAIAGQAPVAFVSQEALPDVGAIAVTGYAVTFAFDVAFTPDAGALAFVGYESDLFGNMVWNASGAISSQRATLSASATVIRHASGTLQSQHPLLFIGTGVRGSVATGDMRSGPASLHGTIGPVSAALQSGPATLKARGRVIRFKPHSKPRPHRINRFNIVLKPNKRKKFRKPKSRRPLN